LLFVVWSRLVFFLSLFFLQVRAAKNGADAVSVSTTPPLPTPAGERALRRAGVLPARGGAV